MWSWFSLGASEKPGKEACLERLGVGGNNVWCHIIIVRYLGPGGAYRCVGGDFKVIIQRGWGNPQMVGLTFLLGGADLSRHHVKIFI